MNPHQRLQATITQIEGAYAPATIRAYAADFAAFMRFCDSKNHSALPASSVALAEFIRDLSHSGRSSASIRRAVVGISAIHLLNQFSDPTKGTEARLEMKRMHRTLGRASKQAFGITQSILTQLLAQVDCSVRGLRDAALLQLAYDTLCRRSELVSLQLCDLRSHELAGVIHNSILLRKTKVDQESMGRWLALRTETVLAIERWRIAAGIHEGYVLRGVKRNMQVTDYLCSGQINRIYKRLARSAQLSPEIVQQISGHSCRVGAAQDLLALGASMPMIMNRGGWSKTDTVMRYLERYGITHLNPRTL